MVAGTEQCDDGNLVDGDGCSFYCQREFLNPIPAAGDHFGWAVAAAGSNVLVGAPLHDEPNALNTGIAYLLSGTSGAVLRVFQNPTPEPGDEFGWAVVALGATIAVGAPLDDAAGSDAGAVYLFDSSTGVLLRTLLNPTSESNGHFGWAVAGYGSNVLVGAPLDDAGGGGGAAYLFDAVTGQLLQVFLNPLPAVGDEFGSALTALGGNVLVGAPRHDIPATGNNPPLTDAGAAYLFDASTGAPLRTFLSPAPGAGDLFGSAVAAPTSATALIGAPVADTSDVNTGAVYLFSATGTLLQILQKPVPVLNDMFGFAVAAVGPNKVLVGAPGDDTGGSQAGAGYLFHAVTGALLQTFQKSLPASGDDFGEAVAAVGPRILIGVPLDDTVGLDAGAAYFFEDTSCGDGTLEPGEQCDDGNLVNGDGCDANCRPTGCGNGIVTAGEQCDDGNVVNGDGCDASCHSEGVCGDGIRQGLEACDDGNLVNGDGCDSNCTLTGCGNGVVTAGEQCDADAANGIDLCCSANCQRVDTDGDGVCDRDDVCPTVPDPAQANADRDAFGDACDLCPSDGDNDSDGDGICFGPLFNAPATGGDDLCSRTGPDAAWLKPRAVFGRLAPPSGDEKMLIKGRFTIATALPALDPERYGIELRVLDRSGTAIVSERIPGGAFDPATLSGWKAGGHPPRKWLYLDKNEPPLHNGIRKIAVKDLSRFVPGLTVFLVKAAGGIYSLAPGQDPITVTVELNDTALPPGRTPGRDQCGEVRFAHSPLTPGCAFTGTSLVCK